MLYLDNAATSYRKPAEVYLAMAKNSIEYSMNAGRGGHRLSIKGEEALLDSAEKLCGLFHINNPSRIAFTMNATYALNMAINGIMQTGGHMITTSMDHNSVLRPAHAHGDYTVIQADETGLVHAEDIEAAIRPDTRLIAMTHVSNVCGTIRPVRTVGMIARKHGVLFLLDAAQSAGCIDIDVNDMHVDMLAFSGHKGLMGPLGTGGLYVHENVPLSPVIRGGTGSRSESLVQPDDMPDMLQSGTMNTPAVLSLASAVGYIQRQTPYAIGERERCLAADFISNIENMDGVKLYGLKNGAGRNGTVAFNINGMESQEIADLLSERYNIAVRGGWHCAYKAHETIGSADSGAVRASFGAFNHKRDVLKITDAVWNIVKNKNYITG